jgi:hypothetical protein
MSYIIEYTHNKIAIGIAVQKHLFASRVRRPSGEAEPKEKNRPDQNGPQQTKAVLNGILPLGMIIRF